MFAILTLLRPALLLFLTLSVVTGIAYPLAVTTLAQTLFSATAYGRHRADTEAIGSDQYGHAVIALTVLAAYRCGPGPGTFAAVLSVACFDFF